MDNNEAKQILELSDNFSQLELLQSYKKNVEKLYRSLDSATINNEVTKFANDIYDNSNAYLALRELNMNSDTFQNQPIIIFTDASYKKNQDIASFGIVVENIFQDFDLPVNIIEKYNIIIEQESFGHVCLFSGVINSVSINFSEIMAILAALEIFQFLATETKQSIVFYTDSLVAKKVLTSKRLTVGSQQYSEIKKMYKNH